MSTLTTIALSVGQDGSILAGPYGAGDVVVNRVSKGLYLITFSAVFSQVPVVVATQIDNGDINYKGGDTKDNVVVIATTQTQTKITTGDKDGDKDDRRFSVVIVGPSRN